MTQHAQISHMVGMVVTDDDRIQIQRTDFLFQLGHSSAPCIHEQLKTVMTGHQIGGCPTVLVGVGSPAT